MKIQKSNNPLAVGALLCVLAVIVGRTVWMVTRGDGSAQMVSSVSPVPATANAPEPHMATPTVPVIVAPTRPPRVTTPPRSTRNPFAVRRAVPPAPAKSVAASEATEPPKPRAAGGVSVSEVRPLSPLPVGAVPASPSPPKSAGPMTQTAALPPAAPEPDPVQAIRLTAIVDGAKRMAVLQTADPQPIIVHEGDTVQGLHVAAIHDREVLFARGDKTWTLPLQTAATPETVTKIEAAPTAEENADATP